MALKTFDPKDPDSVLDYSIDWSQWLASDTLVSSNWTVPSGITIDSNTNDTTSTTIWVSGGTVGVTYSLQNRIVTALGRTKDVTIDVPVAEQ